MTDKPLCVQDPRFTKQLELAVRFGKTLVVTEVDSVDAVLVPLLRRDLLHEGPRFVVMVRHDTVPAVACPPFREAVV
jgi:dynein heavy chain 2